MTAWPGDGIKSFLLAFAFLAATACYAGSAKDTVYDSIVVKETVIDTVHTEQKENFEAFNKKPGESLPDFVKRMRESGCEFAWDRLKNFLMKNKTNKEDV